MREIKFRAWNKINRKFYYFTLKDIWSEGCETQLIELNDTKRLSLNTDFPYNDYEQFTGLKDKNGVEIYEGDILRCKGYIITNRKEILEYENKPFDLSALSPLAITETKYFDNEVQWWSGNNCGYRFKRGSFTCMISQATIQNMYAELIGTIHDKD